MPEKKRQFDKISKVFSTDISRSQIFKFGLGLIFIQFLIIPVLAQSVEYKEGYNVITYDNGSKDIISGALNYFRWDGVWRPNDELNISNGSWPYLYSGNATTSDFKVDDTTLSIPTENTKFKLRQNSISYDLTFSKSELREKEKSINLTSAFIDLPYGLKSKKPKNKYKDKHNIKFGRLHFKAGMEDIAIHDDTLRDYIEDGKIFQDVTYLFPEVDYEFGIDNNGEIRLKFKKDALNKLTGNVTIEIRTWDVIGPGNWGGNVAFFQATDVKATGNVELKQKVTDYSLYTRFDEGTGTDIHNENILTRPLGNLLGTVGTGTWTTGKYGKAIHFDGVKNKVLFNDHTDFRLPNDFTISYYIRLTSDVNNVDTDITRKGSTATVEPDHWWKVEIKNNKMQGVVYKGESKEIAEKDTADRRDGKWHFVAYTRAGTTCSLIVDGSTVASRTNCKTNAVNSAQLAIGAKDTETSGTGMDYTHGTIDEVRFFNRKLSSSEFTYIRNNEHFTSGTVTRDLRSLIKTGEEIKELGCNGTWDRSITKVDIMASTNNIIWDTIYSNAAKNNLYPVGQNNNYKYIRCSLSTTNASFTPIIESIRARISSSSTIPPQPWNMQYTLGNYWINHTWQAGTGIVTDAYNISVNGVWRNGTNPYYNDSVGASNWSNITLWAWNNSGSGNKSALSVNQNIQAPLLLLFINGTIMDSINKTGLEGVKVFTNTSLSTMTNATGFYSFEVTPGDKNITASFDPKYYPNSTTVSLLESGVVQDIKLLEKPTGNITGSVNF